MNVAGIIDQYGSDEELEGQERGERADKIALSSATANASKTQEFTQTAQIVADEHPSPAGDKFARIAKMKFNRHELDDASALENFQATHIPQQEQLARRVNAEEFRRFVSGELTCQQLMLQSSSTTEKGENDQEAAARAARAAMAAIAVEKELALVVEEGATAGKDLVRPVRLDLDPETTTTGERALERAIAGVGAGVEAEDR
eukprot:gene25157-30382_t